MANNIAKLRGKHQITQQALADKIGVTKQGLSFNEVGKTNPKMAGAIAEALGENIFTVLGADALVLLPRTAEDKEILIQMIRELQ